MKVMKRRVKLEGEQKEEQWSFEGLGRGPRRMNERTNECVQRDGWKNYPPTDGRDEGRSRGGRKERQIIHTHPKKLEEESIDEDGKEAIEFGKINEEICGNIRGIA
ncbi:hypothetical protein niasHS_003840 [Heterodera schachtii]|uniref:Uncharacterized protein n=1 Tax=Heterodera schachtii TaxID=97005 RepID=A0ABD2K3F5_HETSC